MPIIYEFNAHGTHISSAQKQLTSELNGNEVATVNSGNNLCALQKSQTANIKQLGELFLKPNDMQTKFGVNDIGDGGQTSCAELIDVKHVKL